MKKWWYVKDGEKFGPVSFEEIADLLTSEKINSRNPAWSSGMETWVAIKNIDHFQEILKIIPPPLEDLPYIEEKNVSSEENISEVFSYHPHATAWSRFIARGIDTFVFGFFGWIFVYTMYPNLLSHKNPLVNSVISSIIPLILEVPFITIFGTTIGKAICKIRVRNLDGTRLSFNQNFQRTFVLWSHGLGFGIPLINIALLYKSYRESNEDKRNKWNEDPPYNVHAIGANSTSNTIGAIIFIFLILSNFYLIYWATV